MRKVLLITLAMLLVAATGWAQAGYTWIPNSDPLLGPHNVGNAAGCTACHTPHGAYLQGINGYLWAQGVPQKTYTTYMGTILNTLWPGGGTSGSSYGPTVNGQFAGTPGGAGTTGTPYWNTVPTPTISMVQDTWTGAQNLTIGVGDTSMHTVLCLSCHDGTFNPGMASTFVNKYSNVVDSHGTLTYNHPVHQPYPGSALNPTTPEYWQIAFATTASGAPYAYFVDASQGDAVYTYGHPAQLYSDGAGNAYIECSTCHNPHFYTATVVQTGGVMQAVPTMHFVRGQYDTATNQTNFCVSCHADKSGPWNGTGTQ